jgi:hypothetical protein
MTRTMVWMMATLGMIALAVACGDSNKQKDVGAGTHDASKDRTATDLFVVLPDTGGQKLDKGNQVKPDAAGSCTKYVAKANTGKTCEDDTGCSADEMCLANDAGTSGSCVGKCCADLNAAYEDPANLCPVPDAAKQKSFCYWSVEGVTDMACAFICSYTVSGTTKTYTCPNATDTCVKSADDPDVSYCDPK